MTPRLAVDKAVFLQALSVGLGLVSAIILGRGGFALSPDTMVELASTKWDYNLDALESLAEQAMDTRVGTVFVVLSVLLQLWSLRLSTPKSAPRGKRNAIVIAVVASLVAWGIGHAYSAMASAAMVEKAQIALTARIEAQR